MADVPSPLPVTAKRIRKPSKRILEDDDDYTPEFENSSKRSHPLPSREKGQTPRPAYTPSVPSKSEGYSVPSKSHKISTTVTSASSKNPQGVIVQKKKQPSTPLAPPIQTLQESYDRMIGFLHRMSGQTKEFKSFEADHSYNRKWNQHPDPGMKCRPAKYLFMKEFPKHFMKPEDRDPIDGIIDVTSEDVVSSNPLIRESLLHVRKSEPMVSQLPASAYVEKPPPVKTNWTPNMHRLWNKTLKILAVDRLQRLALIEGKDSAVIHERNLLEKTSSRFRQIFSVVAAWDPVLLAWLHSSLNNHVVGALLNSYHDSMMFLRAKIPTLIDKFYPQAKSISSASSESSSAALCAAGFKRKSLMIDAPQNVLNMYRPRRIPGSPLFLLVPNGPQFPHHMTSQRMKHWHTLFGSMGKVLTISVHQRQHMRAAECLHEIRANVRDQIRECKSRFHESRPLILVGFGESSLIAAHSALEHSKEVTATICLGFPITSVNGFRGVCVCRDS